MGKAGRKEGKKNTGSNEGGKKMAVGKYGNIKTVIDGIKFDSKAEATRYCELKLLDRAGEITELQLQPSFELVPKTATENRVIYKADFSYKENGKTVVEDVKGYRTRDYNIKRKLFKWLYPHIDFREIKK